MEKIFIANGDTKNKKEEFIFNIKGLTINITLNEKKGKNWEDLKEKNYQTFSVCMSKKGYGCGQCCDYIKKRILMNTFNPRLNKEEKKVVLEVINLWEKYHLNDSQAGTRVQTEKVKEYFKKLEKKYEYTGACEYLKSINLYEDRGYKYGHGWLIKPINQLDRDRIDSVINSLSELQKK